MHLRAPKQCAPVPRAVELRHGERAHPIGAKAVSRMGMEYVGAKLGRSAPRHPCADPDAAVHTVGVHWPSHSQGCWVLPTGPASFWHSCALPMAEGPQIARYSSPECLGSSLATLSPRCTCSGITAGKGGGGEESARTVREERGVCMCGEGVREYSGEFSGVQPVPKTWSEAPSFHSQFTRDPHHCPWGNSWETTPHLEKGWVSKRLTLLEPRGHNPPV